MAADMRLNSFKDIFSHRFCAVPFFLFESEQNVRHAALQYSQNIQLGE